ncbi:hypothetical protein ACIPLC_36145 [Kitasatospora sp. NPDC086801]|uniref:hypothetical protein n=1 Tax=Kitasatospora sp. NPDC086801 TaxID=3364066 RepID=UPI0037F68772
MSSAESRPETWTHRWRLHAAQWSDFHRFLAARLVEDMGENWISPADPGLRALRAQAEVHADLARYRDHSLDGIDAGLIDGLGLALLHEAAARWADHPDYQSGWVPPQGDPMNLLRYDYR